MKMKYTDKRAIEARQKVEKASEEAVEARDRYEKSKQEFAKILQDIFEEKVAKRGEKITSASGETYYYEGIRYGSYIAEVMCHPQKKDGTPSKSLRSVFIDNFVETL